MTLTKRTSSIGVLCALFCFGAPLGALAAEKGSTAPSEKEFLSKASQGQAAEIKLGSLAAARAENDRVKEFGQRMVDDHSQAYNQVKNLAQKEGVNLPQALSDKQQQRAKQFEQLSGKDFDQAYMQYMLRDHIKDVEEFEKGASKVKDPDVQKWAKDTLPILRQHLEVAQTIAKDIGIDTKGVKQSK